MNILHTPRLTLVPLTIDDIKIGIRNKTKLDIKLGLKPTEIPFDNAIRNVLRSKAEKIQLDSENWLFYTFWHIILLEKNCSIGEICFAGPPSLQGEIEVGYYIVKPFRSKGYMTEALKALARWAFSNEQVTCIKARTTKTNYASHSVLNKAGMELYLRETFYWWVLRKQ